MSVSTEKRIATGVKMFFKIDQKKYQNEIAKYNKITHNQLFYAIKHHGVALKQFSMSKNAKLLFYQSIEDQYLAEGPVQKDFVMNEAKQLSKTNTFPLFFTCMVQQICTK